MSMANMSTQPAQTPLPAPSPNILRVAGGPRGGGVAAAKHHGEEEAELS
jgi:hypothetical protein